MEFLQFCLSGFFGINLRTAQKERINITIGQLTSHLKILEDVKQDLTDIKDFLKNGEKDEEVF